MNEPRWIAKHFLLAIHGRLLAEHGGAPGIRDTGLLESALASPRNRFEYEGEVDVPDLAATYAFHLTRNHPFVDGNKRAAFAAAGIFMELNGRRLVASEADAVGAMLALSRGDLEQDGFAAWLRSESESVA